MKINRGAKYFKSHQLLIIGLVVLNLMVFGISFKYYSIEKNAFINEKLKQLRNLADHKVDQISDWKLERFSDARYLFVSPQVLQSFQTLTSDHGNMIYQKMLYDNLNGMFLNRKYESMIAIDKEGRVFFSIPDEEAAILPYFQDQYFKWNLHPHEIQVTDMLLLHDTLAIMQISVPVIKKSPEDTITYGWILMNINLDKDFFPFLETISVPTQFMRIFLLYKESNRAYYLNGKEKIQPDLSALKPLKSKLTFPGYSINEGIDHRNIHVISMRVPISESNIVLVVEADSNHAFADVHKLRRNIIILAVMLVLSLSSTISFFWLKQRNEMAALEIEKRILKERFDILSRFANDAIIIYSKDMTIIQVNDKAVELYGYKRDEFLGMSVDILRGNDQVNDFFPHMDMSINGNGYLYEEIHVRKDGSEFPVEVSLRFMEMLGSHCFQCIIRDITQRKQFEKAILSSEERLRLITNTMPQIVWTADPNGKFDFVNSRFEILTGLDPLNIDNLDKILHAEDIERVLVFREKVLGDRMEHQIRIRLKMSDGTYRWFLCIAIPLCNDKGDIIKWYGSATDIDELENQVLQRTAELTDLYNNAPCGYHSLDIHGTFIKINDTALNWLGYSRDEIIGKKTFPDLVTPKSQEAFKKNFKVFKSKGFINNLEYEMIRKDGTILPVLLSATSITDENGDIIMTRTTIIDHTERKRHENEILKLNTILQEHGYNLEYMNKELEAFIYSVSHDLRAPLRAINGFSRILLDEYKVKLDDEGQRMLWTVYDNANRMKLLIDDLLRLSRTGKQHLNYTRIDMPALFNSMIEETRQQFPESRIEVTLNPMPDATGDIGLLKQVINNLLSNAVKFSGKKEITQLEIGSVMSQRELAFYIKDNGIGFDMKFADDLFGVFKRLNNAGDYEGTGVGLALVKRIIDKHGGKIWAYSEPGMGATFYFSLPETMES